MVKICATIPDITHNEAKRYAKDTGRTFSGLVNIALIDYLENLK